MLRLPVSGLPVMFTQPTGFEDLLLQEARTLNTALALELIGRLASAPGHPPTTWAELTVTDIEALLLLLRREMLGDRVRGETRCCQAGCEAQVDISFGIDAYMKSHKARAPRKLEKTDRAGWFRLSGKGIEFRLPNGTDLIGVDSQKPELELTRCCVKPATVPAGARRQVEQAMEAMAPLLSRMLAGECPECHAAMEIYFDVQVFVLRELRNLAAGVYEDVHLLARHYKWAEEKILALPRGRRVRYAEMIRDEGAAA
ncbi:MAG TPA: hypothetical protein VHT24_12690 [Pseudacidobacterium sp.]|jgi:hypothetical protein|nr:hypothetical protein [Pseudacidobacterium sp.]